MENTQAFCDGGKRRTTSCCSATAVPVKSTSIKAIVNQFYPQGLRMIEIYKHQFKDLSTIIAQIKNRNYKFIIYMDDLSFEEFEIEYKFLKAVIEGGVETKPDNVLIYATSNRRHLIKGDMEGQRGYGAQRRSAPFRHYGRKNSPWSTVLDFPSTMRSRTRKASTRWRSHLRDVQASLRIS